MVVKSADSKRPQPLVSARVEVSEPLGKPAKLEAKIAEPDSGFAGAKKKLISMSGRYKPVPLPANSALAGMAAKQLRVAQAGPAGGSSAVLGPKVDAGIKDLFKALTSTSNGEANAAYKELGTAINKGDWASAAKLAQTTLSQKYEEFLDEKVPAGTHKTNLTDNIKSQLNFLAKLQGAGIKADLPPSKEQLVAYFKTLAGKPADARKALADFNSAFQVHVAQETQNPKADVRYGGTKEAPLPPAKWADVEKTPAGATGENVGKRVNDCEGYAYMAEELMKAAGFKLKHHLTANGGPAGAHAMAVFTHEKDPGKVTLTSNEAVLSGKDEKALADKGFIHAGGKATASNKYYAGGNMRDSQLNAGARKNPI